MDLKIGILLPQSNAYPAIGRDFMDGLEMGMQGSPVHFFVEGIGFGANMEQIINATQKLQNQHRVNLITGLIGHHQIDRLLQQTNNLGTSLLYSDLGATLPIGLKKSPNIFCNSFDLFLSASESAKNMLSHGQTSIAVSTSYYDAGYGITSILEQSLYGGGGQFAGHFITPHVPRQDEAEIMGQFMESIKPQAIYALHSGIFAREYASFLQKNEVSFQYPIYASPFAIDNGILKDFPEIFHGTRCISSWMLEDQNPANLQFVADYNEMYDCQPSIFSLLGYENGKAIAAVASVGGKYSAAHIAETLGSIDIETPRGQLRFHPETNRTTFGQKLWELEFNDHQYIKQYKKEIANDTELTIELLNSETAQRGGWFNAYLCQ